MFVGQGQDFIMSTELWAFAEFCGRVVNVLVQFKGPGWVSKNKNLFFSVKLFKRLGLLT
jgi:hypothetical protein